MGVDTQSVLFVGCENYYCGLLNLPFIYFYNIWSDTNIISLVFCWFFSYPSLDELLKSLLHGEPPWFAGFVWINIAGV
jgi:hypothetical protein